MSLFVIRRDPHTELFVVQRGVSRDSETIVETIGVYARHEEAVTEVYRLRELESENGLDEEVDGTGSAAPSS